MPTAFTHALVGGTLVSLAPPRTRGPGMALALAVVAVLPDADVVAFGFGVPYREMLGHRGLSHSLAAAALVGALAAMSRRTEVGERWCLGALFFAACASHGLLDAFTDAGLGVAFFAPFDDTRLFFPWRPIRTSPIGVQAFFGARGAAVMANEVLWIWTPLVTLLGVGWAVKRG